MKPRAKFLFLFLISIIPTQFMIAQTYDLIILKSGDSIACRIDSVTSTTIYFEMKNNGQWISTLSGLDKVSSYELEKVIRQAFIFEDGSTIIKAPIDTKLLKNSIYIGLSTLCYGHTFQGSSASFTVAGGLCWPDGFGLYVESTALFGKYKHYFETGLSTAMLPNEGGLGFLGIIIRCGYRYQGPKGFLFRSAPTLAIIDGEVLPLPALSFGYSF